MSAAPILDMASIAEAKALMKAKFPAMVQYYVEDAEGYIGDIRDGVIAAAPQNVSIPAHTLKSSSRQLGAMRVSEIAAALETLARERSGGQAYDMKDFATLLAGLEAAFDETKAALGAV